MRSQKRRALFALLAGSAVIVSGCASTTDSSRPASDVPMSPGMTMDGMTVGGQTTGGPGSTSSSASGVSDEGPSASARLTCSNEIAGDVGKVVGLQSAPVGTSTWANQVYTCTYQLPAGPLVLTVKESPDVPAALSYYRSVRAGLGSTKTLSGLEGLGLPAFEAPSGTVAFVKDSTTLVVDATHIAGGSGPQAISRSSLAYEVATDVLGCWSES